MDWVSDLKENRRKEKAQQGGPFFLSRKQTHLHLFLTSANGKHQETLTSSSYLCKL
jgi:hypothetical protein